MSRRNASVARQFGAVLALFAASTGSASAAIEACTGCDKIAVLQMDSRQSCQSFSGEWGGVINCSYGWRDFQAMLEGELAKTRKLQLVEREQLHRLYDEQALQSYFRNGGQRWSYGISVANYIVYGNITELGYQRREYADRSGSDSNLVGTFGVAIKMVDSKKGKIFYTGDVVVEETLNGASVSAERRVSNTSSLSALYGALQRKAARAISAQIVSQIFPIRLLRVTGNQVILNYGAAVLPVGTTLEVMGGGGEPLVDPDTGRVIPLAGVPQAVIEVTSANPDYAVATFRSGDRGALAPNARADLADDSKNGGDVPTSGGAWPRN